MPQDNNSTAHWISPVGMIFWLLLLIPETKAQTHVQIKMCYEEQELEPYFMGTGPTPPEQYPGIFVEMMYLLDQVVPDITVVMHRAPWKRCLNELKKNLSDVIIASHDVKRESYGVYPKVKGQLDKSLSITKSQYCLFTKRNRPLVWNGKSMRFAAAPMPTRSRP